MKLTDKYRPQRLADIAGQPWVIQQLQLWLESPVPCAFVFSGGTGVGKTTCALALARELGIEVDQQEFGGLYQISSGEQTGESVRRAMASLRVAPFMGSGWKMLVVNECEAASANAAYAWLDALENIPARSLVIFTTNAPAKLPTRLRDRCEHFTFQSGFLALRPDLQAYAARVWQAETGREDCPEVEAFGQLGDEAGDTSFRRLLQLMEPALRLAHAGKPFQAAPVGPRPAPMACQPIPPSGKGGTLKPGTTTDRGAAARKAWVTRRARMAG